MQATTGRWDGIPTVSLNTLPDIPHGSVMKFVSVDTRADDNREAGERVPEASSDWKGRDVAIPQLCRFDHVPGNVVEGSIDCQYSYEGCSCCLDTRHGDPCRQAKRSKGRTGGSDVEFERTGGTQMLCARPSGICQMRLCFDEDRGERIQAQVQAERHIDVRPHAAGSKGWQRGMPFARQ